MLGDIHSLCRSVFRASVREQRGLSRLFLEKHTSSTSLHGREYRYDTYFSDIAHNCGNVDADARPGCDTYGNGPNADTHAVNDADGCSDSGTYGSSPNPNACAVNDADGCSDGCAYRFTYAITYRSGKHTLTWK